MVSLVLYSNLHTHFLAFLYQDSFAAGSASEWKALGGTWELVDGTMRNNSDERGAKLVTGSKSWRDYLVEADIQLLGRDGDAGLMARSSDEENGVDSYSGYYAGLRNHDNTLVVGRADHGWLGEQTVPIPGGVHPFHWYHLKLMLVGCEIGASAMDLSTQVTMSATRSERNCQQGGRIGLRSFSSGGVWRNVRVKRATSADIQLLQGENSRANERRETHAGSPSNVGKASDNDRIAVDSASVESHPSLSDVRSIGSLRLISSTNPGIATIRGAVVLTSPSLYVQDATGGAAILQPHGSPLKIGDEVEVTGQPEARDFSSIIHEAHVRLLWPGTPIPPVSVTASQAATGIFDATFIELEGYLTGKGIGRANTMTLELQRGDQAFGVIMNPGRSDVLFRTLKQGSLLRLRGICVVDPEFTHNLTPFVLLLRSADDVAVLAGPPWWTAGHLAAMIVLAFILTLMASLLYGRIERWRLRAVLEERERLAHEVHDTLAQSFAGIGFQLQAIRNDLQEPNADVHRQLDLACDLVRHSHAEARRSIATLRPESLESIGLLAALDRCARKMVDGGAVQVFTTSTGTSRPLPIRTSDALFKIGQEAIANAVIHAGPRTLKILLTYEKEKVDLIVQDDGEGFSAGGASLGFGLQGMRKRADSISANLEIVSTPHEGTCVRVKAPLPPRLAFKTLPAYIWQYFQERRSNAQKWERTHTYSYRG
jgi:signal transduction histidine kinase